MNYEEMSDFEINKAVSILRGSCFDYCNSPSDAWPIIVENRISIVDLSTVATGWKAQAMYLDDKPYAVNPNPLRAAMIVFLKMKDQ